MLLSNGISHRLAPLLRRILPACCHLCGASSKSMLCAACTADLPRNLEPSCQSCDLPLPSRASHCASCLARPPSFDRCISGLRYEYPIDALIHQLKHRHGHHAIATLAEPLLTRLYGRQDCAPELVTHVPLHWQRRIQRGYNQSALIARYLAEVLGLPWREILRKRHHTSSQQGLKRKERLRNLKNGFYCSETLNGKSLALVDDVMTTGATAETVARELKAAGAARVEVWTLARTPKPILRK